MRYSQDTKFVISLTTSVLCWTFFMAESAVGCNTTMVCHKVGTGMNGLATFCTSRKMQISTQILVDNSVGLWNPMYASGRLPTMMNGQLYPPKTSYQDTLALYTSITALPNTTPCERAKECKSQSHRPTKADRPMPVPTNSVLSNDPPWKQGRHTRASLPMHDADDNTIATSTNISPTLPIPRKPPDPVPIPRANA